MALTAKQEAFVQHYTTNGWNATQAAISAGYSEDTARQQASQNLSNLNVKERIKELTEATFNDFEISRERIIQRTQEIAFAIMLEQTDPNDLPDGLKVKADTSLKAIEILVKIGGFSAPEKVDLNVAGVADRLDEAFNKIRAARGESPNATPAKLPAPRKP